MAFQRIKLNLLAICCVTMLLSLTACGGGDAGPAPDNNGTTTGTTTGTTLGSPSVALHPVGVEPFTYGAYIYSGLVYTDYASVSKSSGPENLGPTAMPIVYLSGLAANYCPLGNIDGKVLDVDEALGHYLVQCGTSSPKALYIIDAAGGLVWSSGSYTPLVNEVIKLFNGSLYKDQGTSIQTADYMAGETIHTIHTLTHDSKYSTSRLSPGNISNSITVLADGTIILKVQEYSSSGSLITSSGDYYHTLDATGTFVTKLAVKDLTNWANQQVGGGSYYIPFVDKDSGIDNYGNFGLIMGDSSKVYPSQYLSLTAADFETLHYMITPPPTPPAGGGTGALASCTMSYDYSLNTGDPQVDTYCQTAWAYACAGSVEGVQGTCQILGQISTTYKNQCSYCAGY